MTCPQGNTPPPHTSTAEASAPRTSARQLRRIEEHLRSSYITDAERVATRALAPTLDRTEAGALLERIRRMVVARRAAFRAERAAAGAAFLS
jgi:hypothetical protein